MGCERCRAPERAFWRHQVSLVTTALKLHMTLVNTVIGLSYAFTLILVLAPAESASTP